MRQTFGLEGLPADNKLAVIVSVIHKPGPVRLAGHHILVASPTSNRVPVDLSDADLLAQSIALPLVLHTLAELSGVSAAAFDAKWQTYVAAQDPTPTPQ